MTNKQSAPVHLADENMTEAEATLENLDNNNATSEVMDTKNNVENTASNNVSMATNGQTNNEDQMEQVSHEITEADKTLEALEALPEIMEKLSIDNTQYELHVQLIETLKAAGLPDELENARISMHDIYPLTEALWLDWINDAKQNTATPEGEKRFLELCDLAEKDYLSINVWKTYVNYILEKFHATFAEMTEEDQDFIQKTRDDLLKAVGATAYHVKESQEIWKLYSQFELDVLNKYNDQDQLALVKNMYLDRLKVLHINCEDTFSAYSTFITTWDNANYEQNMVEANKIYAKTKVIAEEIDLFELKLVSDNYSLDSFYQYIENEKIAKNRLSLNTKNGKATKNRFSLNNVRCLYERAILAYCTDPGLWNDYLLFLIEKAKVRSFLEDVCLRAIRNCPWSGALWAHLARLMESGNGDNDQINNIFDRALSSKLLLSSVEDLVAILLAKIDYFRRKIDWEDADQEDVMNLRVVFEEALEYLSEAFPDSGDPFYRIEKYYAYISDKRLGDTDKARELWEDIVQNHGLDTEAWVQYILFERDQGNYQKCATLFKQAIGKNLDNPVRLIDVWSTVEHELGTLESYEDALVKMNHKIKRFSRQWQAQLAIKEEEQAAKETKRVEKAEKADVEKRKKGIHRSEQRKKQKEKKAVSEPKISDKSEKSVEAEQPLDAEMRKKEPDNEANQDDSSSLKRKILNDEVTQGDSKKLKADKTEEFALPTRPFAPRPRAVRGARGKGKVISLGARAISSDRNSRHQTSVDATAEPSASGEPAKSNDDFRKLLLEKK